jgi:hypothetical protein
MDSMKDGQQVGEGVPRPLTPEKIRRARARIAAVHEDIRRRGVDLSRLPDPVEELVKARDAGTWE